MLRTPRADRSYRWPFLPPPAPCGGVFGDVASARAIGTRILRRTCLQCRVVGIAHSPRHWRKSVYCLVHFSLRNRRRCPLFQVSVGDRCFGGCCLQAARWCRGSPRVLSRPPLSCVPFLLLLPFLLRFRHVLGFLDRRLPLLGSSRSVYLVVCPHGFPRVSFRFRCLALLPTAASAW